MEIYSSRKNLVQVAKLYYIAGMSQEEIASIMSVSRSKVSRMLSLAKELNVVQFHISDYPSLQSELECKLAGHFGLAPVIVVPSASTVQKTKQRVGATAAKLLSYYIEDDLSIGLVWGSTADCMVDAFESPPEHEGIRIWFSTGLYIFVWGILIYPFLLLCAWVGALLCPHRHVLGAGDYVGLVVSFLLISGIAVLIYGMILFC